LFVQLDIETSHRPLTKFYASSYTLNDSIVLSFYYPLRRLFLLQPIWMDI
jgi:hypothetical protein